MFSITPYAPIIEFLPAPGALNAGWIFPVAGIAFLVLLIAALGWPIVALVRRRYKYQPEIGGRGLQLHRATRATAGCSSSWLSAGSCSSTWSTKT